MKKYIVSVRIGDRHDYVWFDKVCAGPAETYEAIARIVESRPDRWPDPQEGKDECFATVAKLFAEAIISSENNVFKVERIDEA